MRAQARLGALRPAAARLSSQPRAAPPRPALASPDGARRRALRPVAARGVPPERASLYDTLEVAVGASAEAVKRAYRRLALRRAPAQPLQCRS